MSDRLIIFLLFCTMFVSGTETLIMTPLLPQMAMELGLNVEIAGLWVTAFVASAGVTALIFGPISDYFGRRVVVIGGLAALSLGTLLCGLSSSFAAIFAARMICGAGSGMLVTSATSFIADHFEYERRAEAMSFLMNGSLLAFILGMPLGAFLTGRVGWNAMFLILSAVLLLQCAMLLLLLPHPRHAKRSAHLSIGRALRDYVGLVRKPEVWGFLSMVVINGVSMTMYSVYLSPFMAEAFGFDTQYRGLVYAIGGPAVLIGGPIAGRLSNRFGRVPMAVAGSILVGVTIIFIPFTRTFGAYFDAAISSPVLFGEVSWIAATPLFLCAFLVLLGGATRGGSVQTYAMEQVSSEQRGSLAALINSFFQGGCALGSLIGGFLWAMSSHQFKVICFLAAALNLVAAAVLWILSKGRRTGAVP